MSFRAFERYGPVSPDRTSVGADRLGCRRAAAPSPPLASRARDDDRAGHGHAARDARREMRGLYRPREMRGLDMPREMRRSSSFIPADWKLQPDDPNFSGRRYMAPDGSAWLALYSAPADKVNVAVHLKNVAFADGEEITYLRGARDGLAVSGLKGDRVYYRKAALVLRRHAVAPHRVRVSGRSEAHARPRRGARRAGVRPARRGVLRRRSVHASEGLELLRPLPERPIIARKALGKIGRQLTSPNTKTGQTRRRDVGVEVRGRGSGRRSRSASLQHHTEVNLRDARFVSA